MTVSAYFEGIIKKQKEIGYAFPETLCPPASELEIEEIETLIGFPFNDELKELFRYSNGSQYSNLLLGLIPIHRFLDLQEAKRSFDNYIRNEKLFNEAFENWETGEKPGPKLFPFLADYSLHTYWVDLNVGWFSLVGFVRLPGLLSSLQFLAFLTKRKNSYIPR